MKIPVDEVSSHNTFILYHYLFCFTLLSLNAAERSHLYFTVRDLSNNMLVTVSELKIVSYAQKTIPTSQRTFRARYEKQSVKTEKVNKHYLQRETQINTMFG
jgi:hypothetical protein